MRASERGRLLRASAAVAWLIPFLGPSHLGADTVLLKSGGKILDARILKEEAGMVHLRTPGGKMGVPRDKIESIEKGKSVFDEFDDQLARIKKGDADGRFKLAQWCRKTAGLRQEMVDLLEEVVEIRKDHAPARRMLGHVLIDGKWQVPPPLALRVRSDDKDLQEELFAQLSILFETRKDVRMVESLAGVKSADACEIVAAIGTSGRGTVTFFGHKLRDPKTGSAVNLKAQAAWTRPTPPEITVTGEVDATAGKRMAFVDAMNRNAADIHDFFDQVVQKRAAAIEAAASLSKDAPKVPGGEKAKAAGRGGKAITKKQ